jgi:hypothetical protein
MLTQLLKEERVRERNGIARPSFNKPWFNKGWLKKSWFSKAWIGTSLFKTGNTRSTFNIVEQDRLGEAALEECL